MTRLPAALAGAPLCPPGPWLSSQHMPDSGQLSLQCDLHLKRSQSLMEFECHAFKAHLTNICVLCAVFLDQTGCDARPRWLSLSLLSSRTGSPPWPQASFVQENSASLCPDWAPPHGRAGIQNTLGPKLPSPLLHVNQALPRSLFLMTMPVLAV